MPRHRPSPDLLLPAALALAGFAILVALGNWQMTRKAWKDALEAQIRASISAPAVPLGAEIAARARSGAGEYARVRVRGTFRHAAERYLYAPDQRLGPGSHVLTPLETADGRVVIVNRGYVTDALRDPAGRAAGQLSGEVEVTGLVRLASEKGTFTPDNDPVHNIWYWRDIPALAAAMAPGREAAVLPLVVDAEAEPANPGGWPKGGTTIVKLANRHLEYALTWYGLAATLAAVFAAFAWGRIAGRRTTAA